MDFDPLDIENETKRQAMQRKARAVGGVALIVIGIPLIPLPIPIGGIVTAGGVIVVVKNSQRARNAMGSFLARHPKTGKHVRGFFAKMRAKR